MGKTPRHIDTYIVVREKNECKQIERTARGAECVLQIADKVVTTPTQCQTGIASIART
jgi:hypothetical protein